MKDKLKRAIESGEPCRYCKMWWLRGVIESERIGYKPCPKCEGYQYFHDTGELAKKLRGD